MVARTDRLLEANGTAILTVFDASGSPRVDLTATETVTSGSSDAQRSAQRRLSGEIDKLADDVRRALIANHQRIDGAREIVIEIRLRGPRPSFGISYRTHHT